MIDYKHENFRGIKFLKEAKNGLLKWYPYDTEEIFLNNLKKYPDNKSLLYYKENPIQYKLNSEHFRTPDEFSIQDEGNVYLGCSHTYGIGHHLENTWAYKVNEYIGGKFWNLGVPASGIQQAFILLLHYHKLLKIKNVFVFLPHKYRYTVFNGDYWENLILSHMDSHLREKTFSHKSIGNYLSEEYTYINYVGYLNAIENLCKKNNYKMYIHVDLPDTRLYKNDFLQARDLVHLAARGQELVADMFINSINTGKSTDIYGIKLDNPKKSI